MTSSTCAIYPRAQYDPTPNPKSVVEIGKARFTVLTSHLIRMEWGGSNDAATFAFINRNLPTPVFNVTKDGDWTVIQTSAVKVSIRQKRVFLERGGGGGGFGAPTNLVESRFLLTGVVANGYMHQGTTKFPVCPGSNDCFYITACICLHMDASTTTMIWCSLTTRQDASPGQRTEITLVDA